MAEVHFYLRDQQAEKTTINAYMSYDGFRAKIPTELKIPTRFWNGNKERVKETVEYPNSVMINNDLKKIEDALLMVYARQRDEGVILTPKQFKQEFRSFKDSPIKEKRVNSFWDYFEEFVQYKAKHATDVRDYDKSLRKHLLNTQTRIKRPLSFKILNNAEQDFIPKWERYLKFEAPNAKGEKGLSLNTVGKQNKNLKVFLNWSFDKGIYDRFSLKLFPTLMEEVDNIYLTENELEALMKLKLTDAKEKMVRDLFIIGCETGMRFSDYTRLSQDQIQNNQITYNPKKTAKYGKGKIIIPVSARFERVLGQNNGQIPDAGKITVTQFNKMIRDICQSAGINEATKVHREFSGKVITETRYRYEEVSSHTCRRTFCTSKFLKGMPAQAIMKFSGHSTERNFLKYLKLDAELTARKYGEYF